MQERDRQLFHKNHADLLCAISHRFIGNHDRASRTAHYQYMIDKEFRGSWRQRPDITWAGLSDVRSSFPLDYFQFASPSDQCCMTRPASIEGGLWSSTWLQWWSHLIVRVAKCFLNAWNFHLSSLWAPRWSDYRTLKNLGIELMRRIK